MAAGGLGSTVWYAAGLQSRIPALPDLTFSKLHVLFKKHLLQFDVLQDLPNLWPCSTLQQIIVLGRV